ncbi:extracellular solute-binding protein [Sneathiella litorea]|uniref:Extracellular solute-binding protein n=1 Tax=Sneathiella litorea TaxID=2606216 RepID=A0A6L8W7A0_9PROT|nr:extracellular solute-binding protein [Sneathiella litorea]MZR30402.1 extracellular solute-binding protein [Sneathiella litorea]
MTKFDIGRRNFVKGAAALSAGAAFSPALPAWAAGKESVMATWGGDYSRLLGDIVQPISMAADGVGVVFDTGSTSARKTKVIAQANRPRNSLDIVSFGNADMNLMNQNGYLAQLTPKEVPAVVNVFPQFETGYSIPHIYSALVIVYNKDMVTEPKSYKDLWNKEYEGKIGLANALYVQAIIASALAHGGSNENFDPGYEPLLELKNAGAQILPSNESVANAFKSGEIGVTLMWRARAYQWKKLGLPLAFAVPSEGAMPVIFEAAMTRNASNPEAAAVFLNAMLDPKAQAGFAEKMGYIPTVKGADLPKELLETIGFNDSDRENFFKTNYGYNAEQGPRMLEWWNQTFKAA